VAKQTAEVEAQETERFEAWAYVELMGHAEMAGRVTECAFGSEVFFQVDVPRADGATEYTRLVSARAIYAMTPVSREWCIEWRWRRPSSARPVPYLPVRAPDPVAVDPVVDDDDLNDDEPPDDEDWDDGARPDDEDELDEEDGGKVVIAGDEAPV